jgi:galactofuranose transport system substrate-binding protein
MARSKAIVCALIAAVLFSGVTACGRVQEPQEVTDGRIKVGFSQVGAESGWRTANTASIIDAARTAGVDLRFSDAQQKQENQIAAIRSFIAQRVDVIAFSPVVESGWDTVLGEAKSAGIPVILTDRAIDSPDKSLYRTFIGSDFVAEGRKAGQWLLETHASGSSIVHIIELQGTVGSAPANDRRQGFAEIIQANGKFQVVASQTGSFTRAGGKQAMEALLQAHRDIDVLYAHNDDMALGAIEAIEAKGLTPGKDIKIVSVDAVRDGMRALAEGRINFIVECSPLLGPQLMELVQKVHAGLAVPERVVTQETTFTPEQAKEALPRRSY